jgi:hypothetical protein
MSVINWNLEDDLMTVTVTFSTEPSAPVKIDTADVEDIVRNLGRFRSFMLPETPPELPSERMVDAHPDPHWRVEAEIMTGDSLLHIRDPRFGWLHFLLPRESARLLGETLTSQADAPVPAAPAAGLAN